MRIGISVLRALCVCFLLSGCASVKTSDPKFLDEYLTRNYSTSKDRCFHATVMALKEMKIGIAKEDSKKGVIVTERAVYGQQVLVAGSRYSASGTEITSEQKYSLKISGNENSCRIATTKYQIFANGKEWEDSVNPNWFKENLWDPFFKTIESNLADT